MKTCDCDSSRLPYCPICRMNHYLSVLEWIANADGSPDSPKHISRSAIIELAKKAIKDIDK